MMDISSRAPPSRYKRFLPKSLFGRTVLILIVPFAILQMVVALVFIERHWDGVTRQLTGGFATEIKAIAALVERETSPLQREDLLKEASRSLGYEIWFEPEGVLAPGIRRPAYGLMPKALTETLQATIERPLRADTLAIENYVDLQMQLEKGVLHANPRINRMIASKPHILLVWMIAAAVVLLIVAVIFLRNQVRPIRQLADAAEAFGKGRPAEPFKPSGAEEIRRAAGAFHVMRTRIERQIGQRTMMLSGVSHDLRTPLTRMRLALAMAADEPETDALKADVAEMERMVDGFLAFARGEESEAPTAVNLREMIQGLVDSGRETGANLAYEIILTESDSNAVIRADMIRRCLQNLIGNAIKYGAKVAITLDAIPHMLTVTVEDDGPGIPVDQRSEAFRPFQRLDPARNMDKGGGSGLGLSIALDAARAHGGNITLHESTDLGGLKAVLTLPR